MNYFLDRFTVRDETGKSHTVWAWRSDARAALIRNGKRGWHITDSRMRIVMRLV